jgi:hypothetical protein
VLALGLAVALATPALAEPCPDVPGLAPLLRPGTVLLLGEMHGTVESPAFADRVLCHALARGLEVVVGLEIGYREQPAFDAYLASDGGDAAERALLAGEHWSRAYQDGRSSVAQLDLVRSLRRRLEDGAPLRLVLFDEQVAERDAAMAARLAAAAERAPDALVVALTGNLHARIERGSPWNESFEPMGLFLRRRLAGREVLSLDVGTSGGTAWYCTTADPGDCRERMVRGDDAGPPGVHVAPPGTAGPFSGRYSVGLLHASPPAVGGPERSAASHRF